jgi:hypothetical protein
MPANGLENEEPANKPLEDELRDEELLESRDVVSALHPAKPTEANVKTARRSAERGLEKGTARDMFTHWYATGTDLSKHTPSK